MKLSFVSLQYTKKPRQENAEGGCAGFCFVFKHTQNVRSRSPRKAPGDYRAQNGRLSAGTKAVGKLRREELIHALQLCAALPLSFSD